MLRKNLRHRLISSLDFDGNLQMEDSDQLSFTMRLQLFLATSIGGNTIEAANIFLSLIYCGLFVLGSLEAGDRAMGLIIADSVCVAYFAGYYVLHFLAAKKRLHFMFRIKSIVDLLSMIPIVIVWLPGNVLYVRILRLFTVARIANVYNVQRFIFSEIQRQLVRYDHIPSNCHVYSWVSCAVSASLWLRLRSRRRPSSTSWRTSRTTVSPMDCGKQSPGTRLGLVTASTL